jgi:L-2-hydroxyglutarate oxidase LhgO
MSDFDADAIIVGAGAVGLACGYALAQRGLEVIVLESGPRIGEGVSSRNSEVIHAGFYYPTGSLRARLCVEGRRRLYPFLDTHGVAYRKCGKLIVATDSSELPAIEKLIAQGELNDVEGLRMLGADEAHALEPAVHCVAAVLSEESGVFDSHGYLLALRGEIENRGGFVVCGSKFVGAHALGAGGWRVQTSDAAAAGTTLTARHLITAPGLEAQSVAAAIEGFPSALIPQRYLGKGVYFKLNGRAPFDRLVYPTPIPGALGTHYRKTLDGQAVFGPDLEYVDEVDYSVDPTRAREFYASVRRYWPGMPENSLTADYAGIRPKIHGPSEKQPDFRIDDSSSHGLPGLVSLFGIESPGLTSSLAIGEEVATRLDIA